MNQKIAVLLTCHNRKGKTLRCLESLYAAELPKDAVIKVFLVDDGCTDGTSEAVSRNFKDVNIIPGSGDLFWAGGMRLAWRSALDADIHTAFLLLNDDVELKKDVFLTIDRCHYWALSRYKNGGIYSVATKDPKSGQVTYGAEKIKKRGWRLLTGRADPSGLPQHVDMVNANILWVENQVVDDIGILSAEFTHGIADYDYSLRAKEKGFPVLLAPEFGGYCVHDHGRSYLSQSSNLSDRIKYLKSPTGLAYNEYLKYIRRHFPMALPYAFFMLWMKTFFPGIWKMVNK